MLTGTAYDLPFVAAVLTGTMHVCIHVPCARLPGIAFSGVENNLQNKTQEAPLPAMRCISCPSYLVSAVLAGQRIACYSPYWLRACSSRTSHEIAVGTRGGEIGIVGQIHAKAPNPGPCPRLQFS